MANEKEKEYLETACIRIGKSIIHLEDLEDLSDEDKLVIGDALFDQRDKDNDDQYIFYTGIYEE